jgi:GxxExxY protein
MDAENAIKAVLDCANNGRKALGPGFLEKVYENALAIELQEAGLEFVQQFPISISYRENIIGEYVADMLIENKLILELKAVKDITPAHEAQLVNYLTATGIDDGLLINFGNENKIQIKRKYRVYRPKRSHS